MSCDCEFTVIHLFFSLFLLALTSRLEMLSFALEEKHEFIFVTIG
jgi:hypothetical protein